MALTRVENLTPSTDGSGNVYARLIVVFEDGSPVGIQQTVALTPAHIQALMAAFETDGAAGMTAAIVALAPEVAPNLTPGAINAYISANQASVAAVDALRNAIGIPFDIIPSA